MDPRREQKILEEVVARGLIHADGLTLFERMQKRFGPRLGALIGTGRLDAEAIREIELKLGAEEPAGGSPDEATRVEAPVAAPETRPLPVEAPTGDGAGAWSGKRCGRYEIRSLLGRGGMGEVYRGFDTLLKRHVAVKFLHGDDPRLVARFLQEARLQARIEHEHVCKVYEAGEIEGRPYIVMQIIEGKTLAHMHAEMKEREKVSLMVHVSEAVQSAHRLGLIHRDLKPTNIMVERGDDGEWSPVVMDFGLARDVEGPGTTTTGQAVGTPSYMAPEQAQGLKDQMDRRTDVYGLGATLYHLLADRPPFQGESGVEVLMKVIDEEPVPLRRLQPSVSPDIETIVMKCLEKEPSRRYDSALALAEELRRYLEGEPIQARRASFTYRALKRARKHRAVVVVSALAILAVAVFGGMGLHERWSAAERARLSQEFGRDVERIDAIMRTAWLLPFHDITPVKTRVRRAMERIEEQMKSIGSAATAPGNYALGRGRMLLGDVPEARVYLEKAWEGGLRTPDVATALGLTLGTLYGDKLDDLQRISDEKQRAAERTRLERDLRDPAVRCLKEGQKSEALPPGLVEAHIAYYEGRYEAALQKSRATFANDPSLYDARILEGDALLALANEKRGRGEEAAAMEVYLTARQAYVAACEIARSDPSCYAALCQLWRDVMWMDLLTQRGDFRAHFEEARRAADTMLAADPGNADNIVEKASIYSQYAQLAAFHGEDPAEALTTASGLAQEALRIEPRLFSAALISASSQHMRAEYLRATGKEFLTALESAIAGYKKALEIDPASADACENLGLAYENLADYQANHGKDPDPTLAESIRYLKKAVSLRPRNLETLSNVGTAHLALVERALMLGRDPRPAAQEAIGYLSRAVEINPTFAIGRLNLGTAYEDLAIYDVTQGLSPMENLEKARGSIERALETAGEMAVAHNELGRVNSMIGEYRVLVGEDPDEAIRRALASFERAIRLDDQIPDFVVGAGRAHTTQAEFLLDRGRSPLAALSEARAFFSKAIQMDSSMSWAYYEMGRADLIAARWTVRQGGNPRQFLASGRIALRKAIELSPTIPDFDVESARLALHQSRWALTAGAEPSVEEGIEAVDKALAIDPHSADAQAVRGSLLLVQARRSLDPGRRGEIARQAADALEKALSVNQLLRREYQSDLDAARELAGAGAATSSR